MSKYEKRDKTNMYGKCTSGIEQEQQTFLHTDAWWSKGIRRYGRLIPFLASNQAKIEFVTGPQQWWEGRRSDSMKRGYLTNRNCANSAPSHSPPLPSFLPHLLFRLLVFVSSRTPLRTNSPFRSPNKILLLPHLSSFGGNQGCSEDLFSEWRILAVFQKT